MTKTALVTGGAGFVGRHMTRELLDRGWSVHTVDVRPWPDQIDLGLSSLHLHVVHDLRRFIAPWDASHTDVSRYDLVVHCAYHVGGREAIDGTNMNLAGNLWLDAALFEWAVETGQRRVLYFSSSAAYPVVLQSGLIASHVRQLREDHIDLVHVSQPDADYGWAKITGERLAASAGSCGLAVHVVRPFSGYAVDQDLTYPFPAIVKRAREHGGGDFTVWGPSGQTRDWIHITDVVRGALAVVEADERLPVNLCTGRPTEFGELARLVLEVFGKKAPIAYDTSRPTGVLHRVGDPTRMLRYYEPKISLEESVERAARE